MKSYAGPGTGKMAKCIMPQWKLRDALETISTSPILYSTPPTLWQPPNAISGRCCVVWHVCKCASVCVVVGQISILATRNLGACVLFALHAPLSPLSGIVWCLSRRRRCITLREESKNVVSYWGEKIC